MANKRKAASQSGVVSSVYSLLIGLVIGIVIAAAVAFYFTKTPLPFSDRVTRSPDSTPLAPSPIDPNRVLYGRDGAAGTMPPAEQQKAAQAGAAHQDVLGNLIASLPAPKPDSGSASPAAATPAPAPAAVPAPAPTASPARPSAAPAAAPIARPHAAAPTTAAHPANTAHRTDTPPSHEQAVPAGQRSYLQAGAYRSHDEADAMRARIIMLGLPVNMERVDVQGKSLTRVQAGPFKSTDSANRARRQLENAGIKTTLVHR